jgi:DNA-binding NtrC family response regulator
VISATNADLTEQIRTYQFREDLFYRLNEFTIEMPPLKERTDDIFYLATKFLAMANAELGKHVFGFSQEAIDFLSGHEWSGNIRELKNVIKKATLFANEVIEAEHLLSSTHEGESSPSLDALLENAFLKGLPLSAINNAIREAVEKRIIQRVYEQSHKNKKRTCQALGIDYSTLYRKMKGYGLRFLSKKPLIALLVNTGLLCSDWLDQLRQVFILLNSFTS